MKAIKCQAIITSLRSRADRSLGLNVSTPELTSEEKVAFMELQNINCNVVFAPTEEPVQEIINVKSEVNTKTPSQRLRAVLFIFYMQKGIKEPFEEFYQKQMEKFINFIKEKLEGEQ